jgi:hypothetical protein
MTPKMKSVAALALRMRRYPIGDLVVWDRMPLDGGALECQTCQARGLRFRYEYSRSPAKNIVSVTLASRTLTWLQTLCACPRCTAQWIKQGCPKTRYLTLTIEKLCSSALDYV